MDNTTGIIEMKKTIDVLVNSPIMRPKIEDKAPITIVKYKIFELPLALKTLIIPKMIDAINNPKINRKRKISSPLGALHNKTGSIFPA